MALKIKSHRMNFRVDDELHTHITTTADELGISVGEFLRQAAILYVAAQAKRGDGNG